MPDGYTYDTLIGDLVAWVEDDGDEFMAALDRIVVLGSRRLERDLDITVIDAVRHGHVNRGEARVIKPRDYYVLRALYMIESAKQYFVEPRSYDYVAAINAASTTPGRPRFWCELDETHWQVAPTPDADYGLSAHIIVQPQPLTPYRARTWVAENTPDALLYACLIESEAFLKADERIAVWRDRYVNDLIPGYRAQLQAMRRADYRLQPVGAP